MKIYTFKIENPKNFEVYINAAAETPSEAVQIVNEELADFEEGDLQFSFYIKTNSPLSSIIFNPNIRVKECMIAEVSEPDGQDLERAYAYLNERGYEYDGNYETLTTNDDPTFHKVVSTKVESVFARFEVSAHYDFNIERYSFRTSANLCPKKIGQFEENEKLPYSVQFTDQRSYTTINNLPEFLELYEHKFLDLITALRDTDPLILD